MWGKMGPLTGVYQQNLRDEFIMPEEVNMLG